MRPAADVLVHRFHDEAEWSFRGSQPTIRVGNRNATVDPFPAYPHDAELVAHCLAGAADSWPLHVPVRVHLLDREEIGRTNGYTDTETSYDREACVSRLAGIHIVFSGKRIPPHPGVTRYLVAHEYGHAATFALADKQGVDFYDLVDQYADMRCLTSPGAYGGGTWHATPGEVMACDFRITVLGAQPEYWPHGDIPRPGPQVADWWQQRLTALERTN